MSIEAHELSVRYPRVEALCEVSAVARSGRITAVLGPNASGKSTLLRCLIGAIAPTHGEVTLDGEPVHRMTAAKLARRVAYVAQRPTVSAAFTVRDVVELGRYALPPDPDRVEDATERMHLTQLADRVYAELSVGQQQRVAVARALAQASPDGHFILDEPTAAMDLRYVRDTMRIMRERAASGAAVIVAMHDLAAAARYADDAWLLCAGRLRRAGPVSEVLEIASLQDVFGVGFEWIERGHRPPLLAPSE